MDDVARITLTPSGGSGVLLNTLSFVVSGGAVSDATNTLHTAPTQAALLSSFRLIDDATGEALCGAGAPAVSSLTLTFNLSNCALISPKTVRVRFDSTQTYQSTTAGAQQALALTMNSASNVSYTTAIYGGTPGVTLPANALPLTLGTVTYTD